MNQIVKMNKPAQALRRKREAAESRLADAIASGLPPAIATAKAELLAVISEQDSFALKQKAVLVSAVEDRARAPGNLKSNKSDGVSQVLAHAFTPGLAVQATPLDSLTPDYIPRANFEKMQSEVFAYKQTLFTHLDAFLRGVLREQKNIHWLKNFSCSATLEQWEDEWRPVLRKVSL
jgi:hypothetical protein